MKIPAGKSEFIHLFVPSKDAFGPPALLLLHGTGGDENDLIPLSQMLAHEANILSPRGRVLENGKARFFQRFSAGVFDLEDLKFRTNELAQFVEISSTTDGFNLNKLMTVGYSNGANIAAALLLLFPRLCAGAILFRPMVPIEPQVLPDLSGISVYISAGRQDTLTPCNQPEKLAAMIRELMLI